MRYRTLSRGDARRVRGYLIEQQDFDLGLIGEAAGEGDELDLAQIVQLATEAAAEVEAGKNSEDVEQRYSGRVYLALRAVPVEVRDDTGFWRWITLGPLLAFTRLRDPKFGIEALGAGSNVTDILACRMFLRGQVSRVSSPGGDLDFALATAPGANSHDFWQSHILRRTTGAETAFAQALIHRQSKKASTRMPTKDLRPFVRDSINRKKRTLATFLMSKDEATAYLEHEQKAWRGSVDDDEFEDDLD